MRYLLMLALLAGCGGDDDPHEPLDCMPNPWIGSGDDPARFPSCERACFDGPASDAELAARPDEVAACAQIGCTSNQLALFDGRLGCCDADFIEDDPERLRVEWHECE